MICEHRNVITSSNIHETEKFNELFTITCATCNEILHSDLNYDDFIAECKKSGYILIQK